MKKLVFALLLVISVIAISCSGASTETTVSTTDSTQVVDSATVAVDSTVVK